MFQMSAIPLEGIFWKNLAGADNYFFGIDGILHLTEFFPLIQPHTSSENFTN